MEQVERCNWCTNDPLYLRYHDNEWGIPVYDDQVLFEFLILEGAQAGLSWITILKKREGYRQVFAEFDIEKIASFTDKKLGKLILNTSIIRNRLKIFSARSNAQAVIKVQNEFRSFSNFLWQYVDGTPIQNCWKSMDEVPVTTKESDALSKELKKRGFKFVGSTIMYAYMQAVGMVNDHTTDCFRYQTSHKAKN